MMPTTTTKETTMTIMHVAEFTHAATATAGAAESDDAATARWIDAPDADADATAAYERARRNSNWTLRRAEEAAKVIGF